VTERLIVNTGPLITLARIDSLDVIGQLPFEFICPDAVRRELDEGEAEGYPRVAPDWLSVRSLVAPPEGVALAALDLGEAAVIQLALEMGVSTVAIDEWKGRRAATASGLQVTGTLGLLGRAKLMGLVPAIKPLIERATKEGIRYHPDLIRSVLKTVGEI
jgi:predicted nucleic acid-binding protein